MSDRLHFEDFTAGQTFNLGPHTVTAEAIIAFASEFDAQPFHLDDAAAKASILGGLAASGWHTCAITVRLMCDAVLSNSEILGSSGMDEVKWLAPVLVGDELSGTFTITSARPSSSRPGLGIVNFVSTLHNQSGVEKTEMRGMFFMRRRTT